ncbi:MAG: PDZ domain-containing protein, partial [Actinomycetota bacterium]|nr:PDZ domain-containing protein [Actinomycetota bacterium]
AQISAVQSGGAADQAGISDGDVITKIGDTPISNYADLMAQVLTHTPGETVPVTVGSGSDARTVQVTLDSAVDKQQTTIAESDGRSNQPRSPFGGFGGLVP